MLVNFFHILKSNDIPVSIQELLDLLNALDNYLAFADIDDFYCLSRSLLIKDEKYFDRFDRAFSLYFKELENLENIVEALIPEDWLCSEFVKSLSEEEKSKIESLGGLEKLIEAFKKRMEEQNEKHQGGNKWIGTGGTSPFGHSGYHPEGIRIGGQSQNKSAVKVWDQRNFKNLDNDVELGTRNIKVALRRLRQFARTRSDEELDLPDTIRSTASNAGYLDIKMVPQRHNAVKVLLFFDIGGSMDPYVQICQEIFSAARNEFKHMEYFYFHNFIYESVWKDNDRRHDNRIPLQDILHKYGADYKIICIGDASMSPFEIAYPGGSVEPWNEESGMEWMRRLTAVYEKVVWINPVQKNSWQYTQSIELCRQLVNDQMHPLTVNGLTSAMAYLSK